MASVVSPSGKVIPSSNGAILPQESLHLSDLRVGQQGEVLALQVDDVTTSFLQNEGLEPGMNVIVEAASSRGNMLVRIKNQRVSITKEIAEKIEVTVLERTKIYAA